jgi:hypothetical protein
LSTNVKPGTEVLVNEPRPTVDLKAERATRANSKAVAAKPKVKKIAKPARSSRPRTAKLVCRYCGSDDLAPSFKKRRDARCRTCFKKRYRSNSQRKKERHSLKKSAR